MLDVDVKKQQGNFLVDVAFRMNGAGVTALFGRSGAGKTSVIHMVAGLSRPDNGRIAVGDRVLFDSTNGVDVAPERRRIGYIFQDGRLFPHLSVRANLTYGMNLTPATDRYVAFDRVVDLLGIGHLLSRRPATLSGGEKQRVAIGRALLTSPRLLLMDEPLASLDSARKAEVLPFIGKLPRVFSIPILYVSHSWNEILQLADNLVLMDHGKAIAAGPVEEVMSPRRVSGLAGGPSVGSVLSTVVHSHDTAAGLTQLGFKGGLLKVPLMDRAIGEPVRVRVREQDVAIALERPDRISVQNIFSGTIEEVTDDGCSLVDVRLDIGSPVLAKITAKAKADLDLKPGQHVFALIKSVSISHGAKAENGEIATSPAKSDRRCSPDD